MKPFVRDNFVTYVFSDHVLDVPAAQLHPEQHAPATVTPHCSSSDNGGNTSSTTSASDTGHDGDEQHMRRGAVGHGGSSANEHERQQPSPRAAQSQMDVFPAAGPTPPAACTDAAPADIRIHAAAAAAARMTAAAAAAPPLPVSAQAVRRRQTAPAAAKKTQCSVQTAPLPVLRRRQSAQQRADQQPAQQRSSGSSRPPRVGVLACGAANASSGALTAGGAPDKVSAAACPLVCDVQEPERAATNAAAAAAAENPAAAAGVPGAAVDGADDEEELLLLSAALGGNSDDDAAWFE